MFICSLLQQEIIELDYSVAEGEALGLDGIANFAHRYDVRICQLKVKN
jgi:hypothetical protein